MYHTKWNIVPHIDKKSKWKAYVYGDAILLLRMWWNRELDRYVVDKYVRHSEIFEVCNKVMIRWSSLIHQTQCFEKINLLSKNAFLHSTLDLKRSLTIWRLMNRRFYIRSSFNTSDTAKVLHSQHTRTFQELYQETLVFITCTPSLLLNFINLIICCKYLTKILSNWKMWALVSFHFVKFKLW